MDKKTVLIGAALFAAWYLYNKSTVAAPVIIKTPVLPPNNATATNSLINTGINTASNLLTNLLQPQQPTYQPTAQPVYQQPQQIQSDQSSYNDFQYSDPSMFTNNTMSGTKKKLINTPHTI